MFSVPITRSSQMSALVLSIKTHCTVKIKKMFKVNYMAMLKLFLVLKTIFPVTTTLVISKYV